MKYYCHFNQYNFGLSCTLERHGMCSGGMFHKCKWQSNFPPFPSPQNPPTTGSKVYKPKDKLEERLDKLEKDMELLKTQLHKEDEKEEQEKDIVGFEEDPIFLLSTEEYEKYKDAIPQINESWWLRSPGHGSRYAGCRQDSRYAACINDDSILLKDGYLINNTDGMGVRPVVKNQAISDLYKVGKTILINNFPFIVIDKREGLAIAEVPISFGKFDDDSNDYENSYIRKFLLDWYHYKWYRNYGKH